MANIKKTIQKKVFGTCGICGKTNTPGHTCRIKFTKQNAKRIQNRRDA